MEFKGTIVNRNNRAKEQVLYKVIAEKDAEIARLNAEIKDLRDGAWIISNELEAAKADYRALKSKEYRRSVRRKKQKVGDAGE